MLIDAVFVAQGAGVSKPDDWYEMLKAEYDQLRAEGQAGAPKMMWIDSGVGSRLLT